MTALSRSAIYALMAESHFPKPIRIGSRAVRWLRGDASAAFQLQRRATPSVATPDRKPAHRFRYRVKISG